VAQGESEARFLGRRRRQRSLFNELNVVDSPARLLEIDQFRQDRGGTTELGNAIRSAYAAQRPLPTSGPFERRSRAPVVGEAEGIDLETIPPRREPPQRDELTEQDINAFITRSRARGLSEEAIQTSLRNIDRSELGRGDFGLDLASVAGAFRAVTPQGVRDVGGAGLQQVAKNIGRPAGAVGGAMTVVPDETPLKVWTRLAQGWMEPESIPWENVGAVRLLPEDSKAREIAGEVARVAFDPITWAAVAATGPAALTRLGLRSVPVIGGLLEPLIPGGVVARGVAETAFASVSSITTQELIERGAPPAVAFGAGILAGVGSLPAVRASTRAIPAAGRALREGVTSAEPALRRVVPALGVEDVSRLTPEEQAARGLAEVAEVPKLGLDEYLRFDEVPQAPGQQLGTSMTWRPAGEQLAGTSALSPTGAELESFANLQQRYGENLHVVTGEVVGRGADEGEVLLRNASVVRQVDAGEAEALLRGGGAEEAAQPPARPPAEPPRPRGDEPRPPELERSLRDAGVIVEADKPGVIGDLLNRVPGLRQARAADQPRFKLSDEIMTASVGEGGAQAEVAQRAFADYVPTLRGLDEAFGLGAIEGNTLPIRFLGDEAAAAYPATNTLYDIVQNPHLYDLTDAQRAVITSLDERDTELLRLVNKGYGTGIGRFRGAEGSAHLPNVDKSASAEAMAEAFDSVSGAVARGRGKTRVWESGRKRWEDETRRAGLGKMKPEEVFVPETDIRVLLAGMDSAKARAASGEVFRAGVGGKTRVKLMDELHPGLRSKRDQVRQKITSLRNRLRTAERQQRQLGVAGRRVEVEAARVEKRMAPMLERIEELGEEWGTELSFLSGEVRQLQQRARQLTREATRLEQRAEQAATVTRRRAGEAVPQTVASVKEEVNRLVPLLDDLRRSYKAANPRGHILVGEGVFRYFPAEQAKQVKTLREASTSRFSQLIADLNATALSGDLSVLIGVQGQIALLARPVDTTIRAFGGLARMVGERDLFAPFRQVDLARTIEEEGIEGWARYAFYSGRATTSGTPGELAGGFMRRLPGFSAANEGLYTSAQKNSKHLFESLAEAEIKGGAVPAEAYAAASDVAAKVLPVVNPRRLGQSPAQATAQRVPFTSVAYLRQTAALVTDATRAYAKTGLRMPLTPKESMARKMVTQIAASVTALAAMSAVADAKMRDIDMERHIRSAVWNMRFYVPGAGYSLPIGGPFRGIIQAALPAPIPVAGLGRVPVPFARLPQYFANRISVGVRRVTDLIGRNEDYFGNPIMTGDFPLNILQALGYEVTGMLPLTAGQPFESQRQGDTFIEGAVATAGQFLGGGAYPESAYRQREREVWRWARDNDIRTTDDGEVRSYFDLQDHQQQAFDEAHPELAEGYLEESARRAEQGNVPAQQRVKADKARKHIRERQDAADRQLEAGKISHRAWRGLNNDNNAAIRNILKGIYLEPGGELDSPIEKPENPRDLYVNAIIEHTDAVGAVDWDQVDAWRGGLEDKDNDYIDVNTGYRSTDTEKEYRAVSRDLNDAGFFDIPDDAWKDTQQFAPPEYAAIQNFDSYGEWFSAMLAKLTAAIGGPRGIVGDEAERRMRSHPVVAAFGNAVDRRQKDFIVREPALADKATDWDYFSTQLPERRFIAEALR